MLDNSPAERSSSELLQSLAVIKQLNHRVGNPGLQLANAFGVNFACDGTYSNQGPYLAIVDLLIRADDLTWKYESNLEWRGVSGER